MSFHFVTPVLLWLVSVILAAPLEYGSYEHGHHDDYYSEHGHGAPSRSACSLQRVTLPRVASEDFSHVSGDAPHPEVVALGVGVQNYTCGSTGTYTSTGAVATLFDISCLLDEPILASLTLLAADLEHQPLLASKTVQDYTVGHHYFVNFNGVLSPRFDISHQTKVPVDQYVVAKKLKNVASPDGSTNVDWLQLGAISGEVAHTVYRLSTSGGQPPSSCKPGSADISVKYAAQYWFFK